MEVAAAATETAPHSRTNHNDRCFRIVTQKMSHLDLMTAGYLLQEGILWVLL